MYELFSLDDIGPMQSTETGTIFAGTGSEIRMRKKKKTVTGTNVVKRKRKSSDSNPQTETVPKKLAVPDCSDAADNVNVLGKQEKMKSKRKDKRKKKKKTKAVEIDGNTVENVEKMEVYKKNEEDEDDDKDVKGQGEKAKNRNEDDVLMSLFRSSGIHSALKHDKIEQAGNPDYVLVEKEAERVAKQAINALRQSRSRCRANGYSVPTWTGTNHNGSSDGQVQRPSAPKRRFGKKTGGSTSSSNSTASKIINKDDKNLQRTQTASTSGASNKFDLESETVDVSSSALLARMRRRNAAVSSTRLEIVTGHRLTRISC